jgi:hypothetical protein
MLPVIMLPVIMLGVIMRPDMLELVTICGRAIILDILPPAVASGRKTNMLRPAVTNKCKRFIRVASFYLLLKDLDATITLAA